MKSRISSTSNQNRNFIFQNQSLWNLLINLVLHFKPYVWGVQFTFDLIVTASFTWNKTSFILLNFWTSLQQNAFSASGIMWKPQTLFSGITFFPTQILVKSHQFLNGFSLYKSVMFKSCSIHCNQILFYLTKSYYFTNLAMTY